MMRCNPSRWHGPASLFMAVTVSTAAIGQRENLTAERFPARSFRPRRIGRPLGCRMVPDGDLVRWRADGKLDFLSRARDHRSSCVATRIEVWVRDRGGMDNLHRHPPSRRDGNAKMCRGWWRLVGYYTSTGRVDEAALKRISPHDAGLYGGPTAFR